MTKKTKDNKEESCQREGLFDTWANGCLSASKIWLESACGVFDKTTGFSQESFDEYMQSQQQIFARFYPINKMPKFDRKAFEQILEGAGEINKIFKSWIEEVEVNIQKTRTLLGDNPTAEQLSECNSIWYKAYEKIFEEFISIPTRDNMQVIFENYSGIPNVYLHNFVQMLRWWKDACFSLYKPGVDPTKFSKEIFDSFQQSVDVYLYSYKLWLHVLEKMQEKARALPECASSYEAYKEFYSLWIKTYEKIFDEFFDNMPMLDKTMIMMIDPIKSIAKMYRDMLINIANMWIRNQTVSG